jgi:hypothetical protein
MTHLVRLFLRALPVLVPVLFCALSSQGIENEVWISPKGIGAANVAVTNVSATDVVYGNLIRYPSNIIGTPTYPFRCPDAQSLNVVLTSVLTNTNMTIHFMAGTFRVLTNGIVTLRGWKLRGEGIDNTTFQLVSGSVAMRGPIIGGSYFFSDGVEVSDLTVDCNMQNVTDTSGNVIAVNVPGSFSRISHVKTVNWGSIPAFETFLLSTGPSSGLTKVTNIVIEDCIVTQLATNYIGGITAIGDSICARGSVIRDNFVDNIPSGAAGEPGGFHAITSFNTVSQNYFYDLTGVGAAVYGDSWDFRDIVVDRNIIDNVAHGIYFNVENLVTNLVMKDNIIRSAEGGGGISYSTEGIGNVVTNLAVEGNVVYSSCFATNATALILSFSASGYANIYGTVLNNMFQGSGSGYDLFLPSDETPSWGQASYPYPLQLNTWAGNVNFLGTELNDATDVYWQPGNEDNVVFSPTGNGWYRLIDGSGSGNGAGSGACSGPITVESDMWGMRKLTDLQFTFSINGYATSANNLGVINEIRGGAWVPQVIQARIGSDSPGDGPTYLDINITNVSSSSRFVRVISDGHFRGRLLNPPPLVSTAPTLTVVKNLYVANIVPPPQNLRAIPVGSAPP